MPACAVGGQDGDDSAGGDGVAGQPDVPGSSKADAASDPLSIALTAKYGLRPRRYNGFLVGTSETEKRLVAALPTVTADLNARAATQHLTFTFTEAELATNLISEGGYYLLAFDLHDSGETITVPAMNGQPAQTGQANIDGFTFLGTDTIVDNAAAVAPWLGDDLRALIADPAHQTTSTNELMQTVHGVYVDTVEQGLALNAAMFAWSRQLAAQTAGKVFSTWPAEAKFFWTTVYFNAGPGTGAKLLANNGVDYWQQKWTGTDDPATNSKYARYNALWRTSTWDYMKQSEILP